jgi:hypothetical protein
VSAPYSPDGWHDEFGREELDADRFGARALVFLLGCVGGGFLTGWALLYLGWPGAITTAVCTVCLVSVALVPYGPYPDQ